MKQQKRNNMKTSIKHFTIYKIDCFTDVETIFCFLHTTKDNLFEILNGLNNNHFNSVFYSKENK